MPKTVPVYIMLTRPFKDQEALNPPTFCQPCHLMQNAIISSTFTHLILNLN
nr:MAG TPA: hypothetical protein [Caudoviricetes sp.]